MKVGVPREVRNNEFRVAVTPAPRRLSRKPASQVRGVGPDPRVTVAQQPAHPGHLGLYDVVGCPFVQGRTQRHRGSSITRRSSSCG